MKTECCPFSPIRVISQASSFNGLTFHNNGSDEKYSMKMTGSIVSFWKYELCHSHGPFKIEYDFSSRMHPYKCNSSHAMMIVDKKCFCQIQALESLVKSERFAMEMAFDDQKSSQLKTNDRSWQLKLEAVNRCVE